MIAGFARSMLAGLAAGLLAAAAGVLVVPALGWWASLAVFALIPGFWGAGVAGARAGALMFMGACGGLMLAHGVFLALKPREPMWFGHWISAGFLGAGLVYGRWLGSWRLVALGALAGWVSVRVGALTQGEQARFYERFGQAGVYLPVALGFALLMDGVRRWAGREPRPRA